MLDLSKSLFLSTEGLLVLGSLLSLLTLRKPRLSIITAHTCAGLACLGGILLGLISLSAGFTFAFTLPWSVFHMAQQFTIGPLEAFFILVISVLGLAVSVFSYGYTKHYIGKYNLGTLGCLFNLFILSMVSLVASGSSLMFLFFWELMSMVSYFLVVYEHMDKQVRRAGFIYVVMTHIGTAFIAIAFFMLAAPSGDFSFAGMTQAAAQLPAGQKDLLFILLTLGFGTKAGIIPLHIWLPKAHPAAPSNVSAMMSGVMLKTAIFGFVKMVFVVLGGGPAWWGTVILVIGCISSLLGVLYALMEHDIKRLLAYHSVENIGIILLGLGAAMIFFSYGNTTLAMLGLVAGLFHVFNHAIFKGLLFLGAGSVHYATKTKDMEKMGGLLKRMPWTGLFFLIGSISISALPPFNGFVSEWLTFQALLALGFGSGQIAWGIVGPIAGAVLAITGALAAACFVKAFGIQFLAMPRSARVENAKEVPLSMRLGMGFLAVCCLVAGVLPFFVIRLLNPVAQTLLNMDTTVLLGGYRWLNVTGSFLSNNGEKGTVAPIIVLGLLAMAVLLMVVFGKLAGKKGSIRVSETWNCGSDLTPRMEYTATSFSKPLRMIFKRIFLPERSVQTDYILKPYFAKKIHYEGSITPIFEVIFYRPINHFVVKAATKIRILQSGSIHLYLFYIFITLIVLLIFAR